MASTTTRGFPSDAILNDPHVHARIETMHKQAATTKALKDRQKAIAAAT